MRYLGLVSGGKDSIYSIHCLQREGHQLVCVLYMRGRNEYQDSYMYQTVGSEVAQVFGECLDVPMVVYDTGCRSINQDLEYEEVEGDEIEDLYLAVRGAMCRVDFEGVCSGAIMSRYQKNRVENVCRRLGLQSLPPLWQRPQRELVEEMILEGIEARVVKVASSALGRECINMGLCEMLRYMEEKCAGETNFCGEGGEYESIVVDCPMFRKRIVVDDYEVCGHPEEKDRDGDVFYMRILKYSLETKS